jgi:hypothetical protein
MNVDEKEIVEFLRTFKDVYVSVVEVSRRLGARKRFNLDRTWARPILLRMELDGVIESNEFGEFRLRNRTSDTNFKEALGKADMSIPLGETTIIQLWEIEDPPVES